jgi:hypothetical protein
MTLFNRKKHDIDFIEEFTSFSSLKETSIKLAKDVDVSLKSKQKKKNNNFLFSRCPGMFDFSRLGYIIPSWAEIRVKCNSAGSTSLNTYASNRGNFDKSIEMAPEIIDGLFEPQSDIEKNRVFKIESPWKIRLNNPKLSILLLPAVFHSSFLDDLYVYSGVVDYTQGFGSANFIFTPKKYCELTIKVGEPLLHVIPIYNEQISAVMGPVEKFHNPNWPISYNGLDQWYRKFIMKRKKYNLKSLLEK